MNIHFLGTASGLPTATRFSQTIVLEHDESLTVLDVADGASMLLARQGFDHLAIERIVISHMHADHHSGLAQLLKTMMHLSHKRVLRLWAPAEGIAPIKAYLEACYLVPQWLGFDIDWIAIAPDTILDETITLRAYTNTHMEPVRQRAASQLTDPPPGWRFESYSFSMHIDGRHIVYSGNLQRSALELLPYARGADVIILECAHVPPEDLAAVAAKLECSCILLTHIVPAADAILQHKTLQVSDYLKLTKDGDTFTFAP